MCGAMTAHTGSDSHNAPGIIEVTSSTVFSAAPGFSAAPANAVHEVLARAKFNTRSSGGNGAVRELIDALLAAKGLNAREVLTRP